MLSIVELDSWADFEKIIEDDLLDQTQYNRTGPSFYRGHPDATWRLETTLERFMGPNQALAGYYADILRIQTHIETFTDRNWDLPPVEDYVSNLQSGEVLMTDSITVYMQYLRHFGYPSPLLDWTLSPFVAAYFAFRDVSSKAKSVAIYDFLAASELWLRRAAREDAQIYPLKTASRKNKRHYLQQSVYTVCLRKLNETISYTSHEDPHIIGADGDSDPSGEAIRKYIIPVSERITALQSLEAYNINAYSLFGTEESLLETLFLRDYKSREIEKRIYGDQLG